MNAYAAVGPGGRVALTDLGGSINQSAGRLYNERTILSLIRQRRSLPKAEIARLTGLSAQTVSVIINQLEAEGLLRRQSPQRGRVGQPSVPISLDPEGAFSFGMKLGRRSSDLILMDFCGTIRASLRETYPYPTPSRLQSFLDRGCRSLLMRLTAGQARRVRGLGVGAPFDLWSWEPEVGAPADVAASWRGFDIAAEIQRQSPWPVQFCNDASAACAAELAFGENAQLQDFLYIFIGSFLGGGIVLNGSLYTGRSGNAGALGSLPVPAPGHRLIRSASLYVLERMLAERGQDPRLLWRSDDWSGLGPALDNWIEQAAEALALACVAGISIIDFQAVVIDGAFPDSVRTRLLEQVRARFERQDRQGLTELKILEGSIGPNARAIGAASLPLLAGAAREPDPAFKERARQPAVSI
ncbi:MAG TPA: ROK family transcriptional regulator [Geminicoccus sp.]|jgi:predicted NBD/HSP70 family sugar kinase/biotin operon repressor|uniref:ROK family transcriptional regulator n=1 Tax=Geminicoccus sp. TaxID=2024832 RepID=UPI002E36BB30|nr:ROK family transcriptional regulator [Geminicoccus sp.]HEX2525739.1 ROK family transcriptional regulator [Geminicoccus sp.]